MGRIVATSFTGTFAAGDLGRPLGGVFGHFGDRLGRKKMLVLTMLIMGGCGSAACRRTARSVWPRPLFVLLRIVQGIAVIAAFCPLGVISLIRLGETSDRNLVDA